MPPVKGRLFRRPRPLRRGYAERSPAYASANATVSASARNRGRAALALLSTGDDRMEHVAICRRVSRMRASRAAGGPRRGGALSALAVLLTRGHLRQLLPILPRSPRGMKQLALRPDDATFQPSTARSTRFCNRRTASSYFRLLFFRCACPSAQIDPIVLVIIAFALWEAWKMNTRRALDLAGPYALTESARARVGRSVRCTR